MRTWLTEIAHEITIESFPEELQDVATCIGKENMLTVIEKLGGLSIYFPKPDTLFKNTRDNQIRKEFNGANHRALAQKYNLTESWIRNIVQMKKSPLKRP
jgi:Mor family transcriptional regulator